MKPGTAEFNRKNARRAELIDKRVDPGLSTDEEAEIQALQAEILAATAELYPRPKPPDGGVECNCSYCSPSV